VSPQTSLATPEPTPTARCRPATIAARLAEAGWAYLPGAGEDGVAAVLDAASGRVLATADVVVRDGPALLTSARALGLHTDHHAADVICWRCVRQTTAGGETILADGVRALELLSPSTRATLAGVRLFEHPVLGGDVCSHPLLEQREGRPLLYYSLWFADGLVGAEGAATRAFDRALRRSVVATLRLAPGDVLAIDNRRILHARRAIRGSRDRHLVRSWIATPSPAPSAAPPTDGSHR